MRSLSQSWIALKPAARKFVFSQHPLMAFYHRGRSF
jgi:hypothetical protein